MRSPASDLRRADCGTRAAWWEAKLETRTAVTPMQIGIDQRISLHSLWWPRKEVKQFKAIIKSEVPAALFWGV